MMVQDIDKREFITQMFEGTDEEHAMLVEDVADLLESHATNYKTKLTKPIPHFDIPFSGFPCKSVSRANTEQSSKAHRECIKNGTGKTGKVFKMLVDLFSKQDIDFGFLENVGGLDDPGIKGTSSDTMEDDVTEQVPTNLDSVVHRMDQEADMHTFPLGIAPDQVFKLDIARYRLWMPVIGKHVFGTVTRKEFHTFLSDLGPT